MENSKINFFTRIKKAIFNFDEYEKFLLESTKKAITYFTKILLIFSLIITIALVYKFNEGIKETLITINNEFPDFTIENNTLNIEGVDSFNYYFSDINLEIIMDENIASEQNNNNYTNYLLMLQNKIVLKYNGFIQETNYKDLITESVSKEKIVDIYNTKEWNIIVARVGIVFYIMSFALSYIIIFLDVLKLAIFGLIINMLILTRLKFKEILKISIYSVTLPLILYLIYIVSNTLFGITIKYFEVAYNAIAYIYLITVLLIIKSDIIKNTQELHKLLVEQNKVKEELEREKKEEEEKQEEANKEPKKKKKDKDEPEAEPQG